MKTAMKKREKAMDALAMREHGVSLAYMREVQQQMREADPDSTHDRPCGDLAIGYTWNLRFRGTFGWVMVHAARMDGIRSEVERMAKHSTRPDLTTLQVWDWQSRRWVAFDLEVRA